MIFILHRCDNPPCFRPDHQARGERMGNAKLTPALVVEIRHRVAAGESIRALSRELGVNHTAIGSIIRGRTWTHVK